MQIAAGLERPLELGTNRRYAPRRTLTLGSVLQDSGGSAIIRDLSVSGMSLETTDPLSVGEKLLVDLPLNGVTGATVVWRDGILFGCAFEEAVSPAAISAALLRSTPDTRPQSDNGEAAHSPEADPAANTQGEWSVARKAWVIIALSFLAWAIILAILTRLL